MTNQFMLTQSTKLGSSQSHQNGANQQPPPPPQLSQLSPPPPPPTTTLPPAYPPHPASSSQHLYAHYGPGYHGHYNGQLEQQYQHLIENGQVPYHTNGIMNGHYPPQQYVHQNGQMHRPALSEHVHDDTHPMIQHAPAAGVRSSLPRFFQMFHSSPTAVSTSPVTPATPPSTKPSQPTPAPAVGVVLPVGKPTINSRAFPLLKASFGKKTPSPTKTVGSKKSFNCKTEKLSPALPNELKALKSCKKDKDKLKDAKKAKLSLMPPASQTNENASHLKSKHKKSTDEAKSVTKPNKKQLPIPNGDINKKKGKLSPLPKKVAVFIEPAVVLAKQLNANNINNCKAHNNHSTNDNYEPEAVAADLLDQCFKPKPIPKKKKKKKPRRTKKTVLYEERIIDGFVIHAFTDPKDLEYSAECAAKLGKNVYFHKAINLSDDEEEECVQNQENTTPIMLPAANGTSVGQENCFKCLQTFVTTQNCEVVFERHQEPVVEPSSSSEEESDLEENDSKSSSETDESDSNSEIEVRRPETRASLKSKAPVRKTPTKRKSTRNNSKVTKANNKKGSSNKKTASRTTRTRQASRKMRSNTRASKRNTKQSAGNSSDDDDDDDTDSDSQESFDSDSVLDTDESSEEETDDSEDEDEEEEDSDETTAQTMFDRIKCDKRREAAKKAAERAHAQTASKPRNRSTSGERETATNSTTSLKESATNKTKKADSDVNNKKKTAAKSKEMENSNNANKKSPASNPKSSVAAVPATKKKAPAVGKKNEKASPSKTKKIVSPKKKIVPTKLKPKPKNLAKASPKKSKKPLVKKNSKKPVRVANAVSDTSITETDHSDDSSASDDFEDEEDEVEEAEDWTEKPVDSDLEDKQGDDDDDEEEDDAEAEDEEDESEEDKKVVVKKKVAEKKPKVTKKKPTASPKMVKKSAKEAPKKRPLDSTKSTPKTKKNGGDGSSKSTPAVKKFKKSSSPSPAPTDSSSSVASPPKCAEPVLKVETLVAADSEQLSKASPIEVKAADSTQRSDCAPTPPSSTFSNSVSPPIFRPFDHGDNHTSSLSHLAQLSESLGNVARESCTRTTIIQSGPKVAGISLEDSKTEPMDTTRTLVSNDILPEAPVKHATSSQGMIPAPYEMAAQRNSSQQGNSHPAPTTLQSNCSLAAHPTAIHPKRLWSNASSGSLISSSSSSSPSPVSYSITVASQMPVHHPPPVSAHSNMNYFSPGVLPHDPSSNSARTRFPVPSVAGGFPPGANFTPQTLSTTNGTSGVPPSHGLHEPAAVRLPPQSHATVAPVPHSLSSAQHRTAPPAPPQPSIVRPVAELAKLDIGNVRRANKWLKNCGWQMAFAVIAQNQMSSAHRKTPQSSTIPSSIARPPVIPTPPSLGHPLHSAHLSSASNTHTPSKPNKSCTPKKSKHESHHSSAGAQTLSHGPAHSLPKSTPVSAHQSMPSMGPSHPLMSHMPPPSAAPAHQPQMSPSPSTIPPPMPPSSPHHAYASELDALRYMPYRGYYSPYGMAPPPASPSPYYNPFFPHPMGNFPALPAPPLPHAADPFKSLQDISQRPTMSGAAADPLHRFSMLSSSGGGASIYDTKSKESKKKPPSVPPSTPGPAPSQTPTLPSGPIPGQLALPAPASSYSSASSGSMSHTPPNAHHSGGGAVPPVAFNPFMYPSPAQTTADVMALARMHATALAAAQNSAVVAAAQSAAAAAAASAAVTGQYPLMSPMQPPPGFFAAGFDYLRGGQR